LIAGSADVSSILAPTFFVAFLVSFEDPISRENTEGRNGFIGLGNGEIASGYSPHAWWIASSRDFSAP